MLDRGLQPRAPTASSLPESDAPARATRVLVSGGSPTAGERLVARMIKDAADDGSSGPAVAGRDTAPGTSRAVEARIGSHIVRFTLAEAVGHPVPEFLALAHTADIIVLTLDTVNASSSAVKSQAFAAIQAGARRVVVAVDELDDTVSSEASCDRLRSECDRQARALGLSADRVTCVPVSLPGGDNLLRRTPRWPWYKGPTVAEHIEAAGQQIARASLQPFRLQIDTVAIPGTSITGRIVGGTVRVGDSLCALPSGSAAIVTRINAAAGRDSESTISLHFDRQIGTHSDDVMAPADARPGCADQFEVSVTWLDSAPMLCGRTYRMKIGRRAIECQITDLKYRLDAETGMRIAIRELHAGHLAACNIGLGRPIAFEPHDVCPELGGFALHDAETDRRLGSGRIHFALRRSQNIHLQALSVDKTARAALKDQKPAVIWLTGLPGSGKSSIANALETILHAMGRHTYLLDGDNVRHGLNRDLGFTDADRVENIRRIAEVARLMADAGLIVIAAFISPFRAERDMARARMANGEFFEIHIDAPLSVAEQRDPKGLYRKARRGELRNFTGIDSPYEAPAVPELRIDTTCTTPIEAAQQVIDTLRERGILPRDG